MFENPPKGWVKTTLGEIAKPSRERALPSEFPNMRYVGLEHIEPQTMRLLGHGRGREIRSSSVRFSKGDVLYGKMRPYLNKVWIAEFDGICSAEFFVFRRSNELNSQFLAMRLNADDFVAFANGQVSGERPRVDFEKLARFSITLPPFPEQNRIVAKLDSALSPIANGETATRRAHEQLKSYRSELLHTAVTGKLTHIWREDHGKEQQKQPETGISLLHRLLANRRLHWVETELKHYRATGKIPKDDKWKLRYIEPIKPNIAGLPKLPRGWAWASPEQVSSGDRYGLTIGPFGSNLKVSDYRDSGVPLIFVRNIRTRIFQAETSRFVSLKKAKELNAHQVLGGDLLITKMGDPPGDACLYPENAPTGIITADCIHLRLSSLLQKQKVFFVHSINSKVGRGQIIQITKGVAQQKISLSRFSSIAVPLPPLAEQTEIIHQVDRRLKASYRLGVTLERQLERLRTTRQSLLCEAFAGGLVPQSLKDEPASVSLGRMRSSRETEGKKLKGKHMPAAKSVLNTRRPLLDVLRDTKKAMTPEQLFLRAGFIPSQVDQFYRELISLRDKLQEQKPRTSEAKAWAKRWHVFIRLKRSAKK